MRGNPTHRLVSVEADNSMCDLVVYLVKNLVCSNSPDKSNGCRYCIACAMRMTTDLGRPVMLASPEPVDETLALGFLVDLAKPLH